MNEEYDNAPPPSRQEYLEARAAGLPNGDQLVDYIVNHTAVGGFLQALISNDLRETFGKADIINQKLVYDYLYFMYNYAPSACWGRPEAYGAWVAEEKQEADAE